MTLMEAEAYEAKINEIQNPETSIEQRTKLILEISDERKLFMSTLDNEKTKVKTLEEQRVELLQTNNDLFNRVSKQTKTVEQNALEKQKEKAETITLDDILGGK